MTALWIILFTLVLILVYLLLTPLSLAVDSRQGTLAVLHVSGLGYGRMWWQPEEGKWMIGCRLLWIKRSWDANTLASKWKSRDSDNDRDLSRPRKGTSKQIPFSGGKVVAVLKSFRIRELKVQFDSGDVVLNGMLYPVFYWIGMWSGHRMEVNFLNKNELVLLVENCLGRMLWAWLFGK